MTVSNVNYIATRPNHHRGINIAIQYDLTHPDGKVERVSRVACRHLSKKSTLTVSTNSGRQKINHKHIKPRQTKVYSLSRGAWPVSRILQSERTNSPYPLKSRATIQNPTPRIPNQTITNHPSLPTTTQVVQSLDTLTEEVRQLAQTVIVLSKRMDENHQSVKEQRLALEHTLTQRNVDLRQLKSDVAELTSLIQSIL